MNRLASRLAQVELMMSTPQESLDVFIGTIDLDRCVEQNIGHGAA